MKRKRYTEDLEFRISEDDDSGDDSTTPKSPSSSSQQQVKLGFLIIGLPWIIGVLLELNHCQVGCCFCVYRKNLTCGKVLSFYINMDLTLVFIKIFFSNVDGIILKKPFAYKIPHSFRELHPPSAGLRLSTFALFQDAGEVEGPVVEKIMGMRSSKKQVRRHEAGHQEMHAWALWLESRFTSSD